MGMETHRKDWPHPEMTSTPPSPLKYDIGKTNDIASVRNWLGRLVESEEHDDTSLSSDDTTGEEARWQGILPSGTRTNSGLIWPIVCCEASPWGNSISKMTCLWTSWD